MLRFPRDFFLAGVCIVYATAFASLRSQIRGLYGEDGLEPVDIFLYNIKRRYDGPANASTLHWVVQYPTLVWLHEPLQWSPSFCMEVICLVGTTLAVLGAIQPAFRTAAPMTMLWLCYLSIVQCGQTFLQFQWDSLLLEVGVLATLLAPWWHCCEVDESFETPSAAVWTLRFMFFKFMLMSGAVKIQSGCPTWLGLSALDFHYATQPLPLSLSWYALQAPPIINRLAVAVTLLIEGPWTFLLLAPHVALRRAGAIQQIALQISIIFTGNYNFFNMLTIVLAAALIDIDSTANSPICRSRDEEAVGKIATWVARVDSAWHAFQTHVLVTRAMLMLTLCYCVYSWLEVFEISTQNLALDVRQGGFQELLLATSIRLLPGVEDTQVWLARILPRCVGFSIGVLICSSCWQILRCIVGISQPKEAGRSRKRLLLKLVYLMTTTIASCWVFMSSVVTLSVLDQSFQQMLPQSAISVYHSTAPYRVTNAYGLFRTMTGVGTVQLENGHHFSVVARPEIILEGTKDGGVTWEAYHFQYKPGEMTDTPRLVAPFHPRLDWQMWFAALGNYQGAPWLVHLVAKLLDGSQDVKELLDTTRDPFTDGPPDAIRAQLYYYDFTRLNTSWNRAIPTAKILEGDSDPQWWTRTFVKEYMPALERNNPSLSAFVQHHWPRSASTSNRSVFESQLQVQALERLCRDPWSPLVLAVGVLVIKSGVVMASSWWSHAGKVKLQ